MQKHWLSFLDGVKIDAESFLQEIEEMRGLPVNRENFWRAVEELRGNESPRCQGTGKWGLFYSRADEVIQKPTDHQTAK